MTREDPVARAFEDYFLSTRVRPPSPPPPASRRGTPREVRDE